MIIASSNCSFLFAQNNVDSINNEIDTVYSPTNFTTYQLKDRFSDPFSSLFSNNAYKYDTKNNYFSKGKTIALKYHKPYNKILTKLGAKLIFSSNKSVKESNKRSLLLLRISFLGLNLFNPFFLPYFI